MGKASVVLAHFLALAIADVIVGCTMFCVSTFGMLMTATMVLAAFFYGVEPFLLVAAVWCAAAAGFGCLLVVVVRSAWKLPKELWHAPPVTAP